MGASRQDDLARTMKPVHVSLARRGREVPEASLGGRQEAPVLGLGERRGAASLITALITTLIFEMMLVVVVMIPAVLILPVATPSFCGR